MREKKTRPTPTIAPAMVSQLTSIAILGVDERRFLEQVLPLCAGHVTRLGKLRLVPIDVALARLGALAKGDDVVPAPANDSHEDDDRDLGSIDSVLRAVGRRRIAGGT